MGTINTALFQANEIAKADDLNRLATSAQANLALILKQIIGACGNNAIVQGLAVTPTSPTSLNVMLGQGMGFCIATEIFCPNAATLGPIPFAAPDLVHDRIDVLEIQAQVVNTATQQRAFKDPTSGVITSSTVATQTNTTTLYQIREGTPATVPVASAADGGWIKIAEVRIRANTTSIEATDIYNCSAAANGLNNRQWTTGINDTFQIGDLSAIKSALVQLQTQVQTDEIASGPGMRKLLIYYAYLSSINNSFASDLNMARGWLALYDVIVISFFGPVPSDDPRRGVTGWLAEYEAESANVVALINLYHQDRPDGLIFMYTPIGRAGFTMQYREFTEAEILTNIQWMARTAGVDGVFLDEAGWDYGVSREQQNHYKNFAKTNGLRVMWNSWRSDDAMSTYIVQREWQGAGLQTNYMTSGYTAAAGEVEVWENGIQYSLYSGGGDPAPGQFKEYVSGSIFAVIVNKTTTSYVNPWVEIRNKRGNTSETGGNMSQLPSQADSDDYWLYESLVSSGNYNDLVGNGQTFQRYGWEMNKWMYSKSDRALAGRAASGCNIAAITTASYADMFQVNSPAIMAGSYWHYKWTDIQEEPLIQAMLSAAYMWAIMYGFDSWGHSDPNYSASSAKTFPFDAPKINIRTIGKPQLASPVHLDGPIAWGAFNFQAVHSRSFSGGKIFCIFDGRPVSYHQPLKFIVMDSPSQIPEFVGAVLGLNAQFIDGLTRDQIARRDSDMQILSNYTFLQNLTMEGIPTFRQLTGDHRFDDPTVDALSTLIELTTGDVSDNHGVPPEGNAAVFEASYLGNAQNPNAFQYNGKSRAMFGAIVNLIPDPLNCVSTWTGSNATLGTSSEYIGDYLLAKILFQINNGTWNAPLDFSGATNLVPHGVSIVLRQGNDDMAWISVTDSTAAALKMKIRIEFTTRRAVVETVSSVPCGALVGLEWFDDKTVLVKAITLNITKANTHYFSIEGNLGASANPYFVYAGLPCLAQDQTYPTAFANGTRSAMKSSLQVSLSSTVSIRAKVKPWFLYSDAGEHCIFNWVVGGSESTCYLKLMWETYNAALVILSIQWGGYVACVAGDIGKTVTGTVSGASGVLQFYDNVNRYWKVLVSSGSFNLTEAVTIGSGTGAGTTAGGALAGLMFVLKWKNGGTERTMSSSIFDAGANFTSLNQNLDFALSLDLTTGTTAGPSMWINGVLQNTAWSGAADTIGSAVFNWLHMGWNGTAGYWGGMFSELDVFSGVCTQDNVNDGFVHNTVLWQSIPEDYEWADQVPSVRSVNGFWGPTTNAVNPDLTNATWNKSSCSVTDSSLQIMGQPLYKLTTSVAWGYAAFGFAVATAHAYYVEMVIDGSLAANFQVSLIDSSYVNQLAVAITWATKSIVVTPGSLVRATWLTPTSVKLQLLSDSLPIASGYQLVLTNPATTDINAVSRVAVYADGIVRPWTATTRDSGYLFKKFSWNKAAGYVELDFKATTTGDTTHRRYLLTDCRSSTAYGLNVYIINTTLYADFRNTNGTVYSLSVATSIDIQHHVKIWWNQAGAIVGMNVDNVIATASISASYPIAFQDNMQIGASYFYTSTFLSLDGYIANVKYSPVATTDNVHSEKARPYFAKSRLIGKDGNWSINAEGGAAFTNLKIAEALSVALIKALNGQRALEIDDNGNHVRIDIDTVLAATKSLTFEGQGAQLEPFLGYARYKP